MPAKRNSKNTPGAILLPVPTFTPVFLGEPSYMSSCKISAKSDNLRPSYGDLAILPFGPILVVSHPQPMHKVWTPSVINKFFLDFGKSPPIRNNGAPKTGGRNFGQNLLRFVKYGGGWRIFMDWTGVQPGRPPMTVKPPVPIRLISIHKFGCQKSKKMTRPNSDRGKIMIRKAHVMLQWQVPAYQVYRKSTDQR